MTISTSLFLLFVVLANYSFASPLTLEKRRFGQENKIQQLISSFSGVQNVNSIAGPAIGTLLAAANPCNVVDVAQQLIDAGGSVEDARKVLALEKNFNPFVVQAASICLDPSKPENPQLRGILPLVDPALPGAAEINAKTQERNAQIASGQLDGAALAQGKSIADQMVELGFTAIQGINGGNNGKKADGNAGKNADNNAGKKENNQKNAGNGNNANTGNAGSTDFGTCEAPTIEFGVGFDGRKENSFRPVNQKSFNHGSAQNIGIITGFICDRLKDTCKAPAAGSCQQAIQATQAAPKGGAQADAFNSVFGINTNFENGGSAAVVDNGNQNGGNNDNAQRKNQGADKKVDKNDVCDAQNQANAKKIEELMKMNEQMLQVLKSMMGK
ncbi:hypothetical protein BKA69DRAFT_1057342 [Paraphysoderma sedebokerense]|nr:hypothetical protein BKA69DRAFT_1057342 [Paraphysoderma sedebokerense]